MRAVVLLAILAGCVSPAAVSCPSGLVCPSDTKCRPIADYETCATDAQLAACEGKADLDGCDDTDPRRHCLDGVCMDPCGNGHLDQGETCDDGNVGAGDGCSSICLEETCGNGAIDLVLGEECDNGMAGLSGDGCSSTCRIEQPVWSEIIQRPLDGRAEHAMVYDAERDQIVLFGGISADGIVGDTWVWNGTTKTWARKAPARSPSPRYGHAMAYDRQRQRVVLFGGYSSDGFLDDTWEWDGLLWTERTPATGSPFRRMHAAMTYDPVRKLTVLEGGATSNGNQQDFYEWNGTTWTSRTLTQVLYAEMAGWTQLAYDESANELIWCVQGKGTFVYATTGWTNLTTTCPANGGAASSASRMVYDPLLSTLVSVVSNGTVYHWNRANNTWNLHGGESFGTRYLPALAADGKELVLFGGHSTGALSDPDPTLFDNRTWLRDDSTIPVFTLPLVSSVVPQRRFRSAGVYASRRALGIVFGGFVDGAVDNTTWEFDVDGWHPTVTSMPPRFHHAMAYDSDRDEVVMFGGLSDPSGPPYAYLQATRVLGATGGWQTPSPGTEPSARRAPAMAYDSKRKQIVLFGGHNETSGTGLMLADTWIWDGATHTWTQRTPVTSPPLRSMALMAYDPDRDRVVLYGGSNGSLTYARDTWEWDGATWKVLDDGINIAVRPEQRGEGTLVWDPLRHRVVLFGGGAINYDGAHYNDVWEWDGTTWLHVHDDSRLSRAGQTGFYDPIRGGLVTYGGETSNATGVSDRTWILRYESLATRESCRLPDADDDGDTLVGCSDPDCAPRCSACGNGTCDPAEDALICDADCN